LNWRKLSILFFCHELMLKKEVRLKKKFK